MPPRPAAAGAAAAKTYPGIHAAESAADAE